MLAWLVLTSAQTVNALRTGIERCCKMAVETS